MAESKNLQSDIEIVGDVNRNLEDKILKKIRRRRSNIAAETTWKYHEYQTAFLIKILKTHLKDIEYCHRLSLSRNSRGQDKRAIVKFVNRKHSEALLKDKKRISGKSFNHLNVPNNFFVSVSLCPYYSYIWDRCKDLQRQGQ